MPWPKELLPAAAAAVRRLDRCELLNQNQRHTQHCAICQLAARRLALARNFLNVVAVGLLALAVGGGTSLVVHDGGGGGGGINEEGELLHMLASSSPPPAPLLAVAALLAAAVSQVVERYRRMFFESSTFNHQDNH